MTTRATGVIDYTKVATYKAANGDELHTISLGTATPNETGLTLAGVKRHQEVPVDSKRATVAQRKPVRSLFCPPHYPQALTESETN